MLSVLVRGFSGVSAGVSLLQEALGEERFEKGRKRTHGNSLRERSSFRAASAMSSGDAVRYQYVDDGSACPR